MQELKKPRVLADLNGQRNADAAAAHSGSPACGPGATTSGSTTTSIRSQMTLSAPTVSSSSSSAPALSSILVTNPHKPELAAKSEGLGRAVRAEPHPTPKVGASVGLAGLTGTGNSRLGDAVTGAKDPECTQS